MTAATADHLAGLSIQEVARRTEQEAAAGVLRIMGQLRGHDQGTHR